MKELRWENELEEHRVRVKQDRIERISIGNKTVSVNEVNYGVTGMAEDGAKGDWNNNMKYILRKGC